MLRRRSDIFLCYVAGNIVFLALLFVHAFVEQKKSTPHLDRQVALVERLQITDLSLFTDARYTRHPSMADLHTAFQDHPLSLEHFPSGTIMTLPRHLKSNGLD